MNPPSSSPPAFSSSLKRLATERRQCPDLVLSSLQYNSTTKRVEWVLTIPPTGPFTTPLNLQIGYESSYPFTAPYLRFLDPVPFHPNIHPSGVMSNLMVEAWSPLLTVQRIYDNALDILTEPLPEYPYNEAAYEAWKKTLLSQQQP